MNLNRQTVALVMAVLLAALVSPSTTALAAGGEVSNAGLLRNELAHSGDQSGDDAESPDEGADASDTVSDSEESSDEPRHHDDSGDDGGDSGGGGPCTSVSSVSVCIDQPR